MIYDHIKNASLYYPISERIQKALIHLSKTNFENVEPGKYEIEGDEIFLIVSEYNTKPFSAAKWEAHKKYIDIQFMIHGKEKMGFADTSKMVVIEPYDDERDYVILKGEGNYLIAEEKHFAIFFPGDAHVPSVAVNIPKQVKKVVVKVLTDQVIEDKVEDTNAGGDQATEETNTVV